MQGTLCRLRALEPGDGELLCRWENDPAVWAVSGTQLPFSRAAMEALVASQQGELFRNGQQRLIIETLAGNRPVGVLDLFEVDALHRRAGIGILIHDPADRGRGYAADALRIAADAARRFWNLHQLWCTVEADNAASLRLFRGAGFEQTGCRRSWNWSPEGWKDEWFFQLLLE